jgi:hypothetical protein
MIDYTAILTANYVGAQWNMVGDEYSGLDWLDSTPKPTQAELDAAWPQVDYNNQYTEVSNTRHKEYIRYTDGIFFAWQRGDATEVEWRDAVAKIKSENPYPPNPAG